MWYRTTDALPPINVRVRVSWGGRMFEAARAKHPTSKSIAWLTEQKRRPLWLPVDIKKTAGDFWRPLEGHQPELWQPIRPDAWDIARNPLPEPVPQSGEGIMWSSRQSMSAVDMAEEMERDREDARSAPRETATRESQWWRIGSDIKYEQPGAITPRMCEGRIMRALCYDRTIRMDIKPYRTNAAVMADLKRGMDEIFGDPTADYRPPYQPNNQDGDDYLVAMGWIIKARPNWRRMVTLWGRVPDPPHSWMEIGDKLGVSRQRAQAINASTLLMLTAAANGRRS